MLRIWVADERLPLSISSLANSSLVNSLGRKVSRFSPKKKELCHKLQSPTTKLLCGANYSAAFPCAIHAIVKKRETAHTTIHYELRTMNNSTPSTIKNRVLVQYCPYNNRVLVQKVAGIFG